jgi:hypothetical protein
MKEILKKKDVENINATMQRIEKKEDTTSCRLSVYHIISIISIVATQTGVVPHGTKRSRG